MAEPERKSRSDNDDDDGVSEAGDIGDRSLRRSNTPRILSLDYLVEAGSINEENATATPQENEHLQKMDTTHFILDYITCLTFLALFGILGVIARYGLHILFGHRGMPYPDLASNMVGSFLMGWFGVVFRPSISRFSENLAIGLTTGFLGSLTTFSGWNQTLVKLSIDRGHWLSAFCTAIVGLCLAASSIYFGVQTANGGKKWLIKKCSFDHCSCNLNKCLSTLLLTLILSGIWAVFIFFSVLFIKTGRSDYVTEFFLACAVGPFGVWTRWALARCNGHGFGKKGRLRWVPFGTLVANVVASVLMAGLAIVRNAVDIHGGRMVATGAQIGFCGCLSTVSAFIAEFYAMNESSRPWRAYAYAFITIIISFGLGILVYSVPIWVDLYE